MRCEALLLHAGNQGPVLRQWQTAIARRCALRVSSQPGASLFGGGKSSVEWATFVNGLLIRYLDYNDTYLSLEPAHPSDNLAAVLSVGEMTGATGQEMIVAEAIVIAN